MMPKSWVWFPGTAPMHTLNAMQVILDKSVCPMHKCELFPKNYLHCKWPFFLLTLCIYILLIHSGFHLKSCRQLYGPPLITDSFTVQLVRKAWRSSLTLGRSSDAGRWGFYKVSFVTCTYSCQQCPIWGLNNRRPCPKWQTSCGLVLSVLWTRWHLSVKSTRRWMSYLPFCDSKYVSRHICTLQWISTH